MCVCEISYTRRGKFEVIFTNTDTMMSDDLNICQLPYFVFFYQKKKIIRCYNCVHVKMLIMMMMRDWSLATSLPNFVKEEDLRRS